MTEHPEPATLLKPWLDYQASLTEKLKVVTGQACLDILNQSWEANDQWDAEKLKLNNTTVMHRDILMWSCNTPCWYARTILPLSTYEANQGLFDRLKTEYLGQLILNNADIQRVSFKQTPITEASLEYEWLMGIKTMANYLVKWKQEGPLELWMRLSEFQVRKSHSFFLAEILLPGLLEVIQ